MPVQMSMNLETGDFDAELKRLEDAYADANRIIHDYAALIVMEAKSLSPVRTGALRDSITWHAEDDVYAAEITAGEGIPDARAFFMEYGTVHITPRYFFRVAFERYQEGFIQALNDLFSGTNTP